jgi:hypothetical protein
MKLRHVLLLPALLSMIGGCVSQPGRLSPEPVGTWSSLAVDDAEQVRLVDKHLPVQGWTSLEIVMRGGNHEGAAGVFVDINGNQQFVSWADLAADPLGQRLYSDSIVKAGELTLRVTRAPCGGRTPLVFQVRELRSKGQSTASAGAATLADISYEPLSGWTESGLYLPDHLINRIDDRWEGQECQYALAPGGATSTQQALVQSRDVLPAASNQRITVRKALEPETKAEPIDPYGKPCRLCRKDDTGDDDYGGDDKW